MPRSSRRSIIAAPLALMLATATALTFSVSAPLTLAQGDSDAPHPAHIHSGTCDDLGDIVAPLTDVAEDTAGEGFGAAEAVLVKESETDVPLALSAILGAPHAINIHESAENIQTYIACGEIGGRVVDGDLLIGLREINNSGHSGIARLETNDDATEVYVYLGEFGADGAAADDATDDAAAADDAETPAADDSADDAETPAAVAETPVAETPADAAAVSEETPVDIRDFAYGPNPVEIAAGGTITWTNQDEVPHTATAETRDALQSGAISPGSSFSQVFATPGDFNYFCEFHPNMEGLIVVQ